MVNRLKIRYKSILKPANLYGVILAGGFGTRLWPVSREFYPKQLLKLFGNKTLIQQTFFRLKKFIPAEKIYITTNKTFQDDIYFQLKGIGCLKENIFIEPALKNTAPAIGFAGQRIFNKDKEAYLLVCPADHLISPDAKFAEATVKALESASKGFLTTFGIAPDCPSSEYGYIKPKSKIQNPKSKIFGYGVEKFAEKPTKEKAEEFIKEGYLWNSGIFVFKAETLLENIKKHLPDLFEVLKSASKGIFNELYSGIAPISIDYGIMEKTKKAWVIPASFRWCDIGSWKALYDILPKSAENNVIGEKVLQFGCKNSLIYGSPKRVVAALGIDNLVVVDTEDAVLVAEKSKINEIKKILEEIKNKNFSQYREHPTVYRPWGYYTVLEEGDGFKVKKIRVLPKRKLSLQAHKIRSEHWVVLTGTAKVELNGEIKNLGPHQSIGIPQQAKHRLENPGKEPLDIVEIQNGSYLGEDDIVRFEDKYGRNISMA